MMSLLAVRGYAQPDSVRRDPGGGGRARRVRGRWQAFWPAGALLAAALAGGGCQSWTPSPYISPRVEGRVVDADSQRPLARVKIKRVWERSSYDTGEARKGAQTLERSTAILTDPEGRFVVDSERDLVLLRRTTWFTITLAFERDGYERLTVTYSTANVSTNSPGTEPVVEAGDVRLHPASP
jgi:hypothetical protein